MNREHLWKNQSEALRDPLEVASCSFAQAGVTAAAARLEVRGEMLDILDQLACTLVVTREYENLVTALSVVEGRLLTTHLALPHPSGLAYDERWQRLYLASTRNPNRIVELVRVPADSGGVLVPARSKCYPGRFYFHDLAFVEGRLMANSVGQNGVLEVDWSEPLPEPLCWWPRCVEPEPGRPEVSANMIQLNSIAAGATLADSFFTASSAVRSRRRPGHRNYPVEGCGVVFSGRTREVVAGGLTRPHSARLQGQRLWLNNSGFGQLGWIESGRFHRLCALNGWTRGLAICGNLALVGLSRVLPRFEHYAPGLRGQPQRCAVAAVCLASGRVLGEFEWPAGNQIFGLECLPRDVAQGFPISRIAASGEKHRQFFRRYL